MNNRRKIHKILIYVLAHVDFIVKNTEMCHKRYNFFRIVPLAEMTSTADKALMTIELCWCHWRFNVCERKSMQSRRIDIKSCLVPRRTSDEGKKFIWISAAQKRLSPYLQFKHHIQHALWAVSFQKLDNVWMLQHVTYCSLSLQVCWWKKWKTWIIERYITTNDVFSSRHLNFKKAARWCAATKWTQKNENSRFNCSFCAFRSGNFHKPDYISVS